VFDNLLQPGTEMMLGEVDEGRLAFAADLADRWVAFAAADDPADVLTVPGTDEPWPAYEPGTRRQVVLDLESRVVSRLGDDRRALWSD